MPIDTATITDLNNIDRLNAIVDHLKSMPLSQRAGIMEIVQRGLKNREKARLKYNWPLHARDSQLPPPGDWDTWLILAGRGFGKTRTGAEWVRAQSLPRTPIRGRRPPRDPHRPRRAHPARSTVHHDRGRVRHHQHIPALEPAHLRAVQAQSSPGPAERTPSYSPATNPTS